MRASSTISGAGHPSTTRPIIGPALARPRRPTEPGEPLSRSLTRPLSTLAGLAGIALKRLWHHPGLTLLALLGIVLAVGLITSASFFSQAVDMVILRQELADLSRVTGRPPFSTRVYYFPSPRRPLTLEAAEKMGRHVAGTLSSEVGLPLEHLALQVESGSMMLQSRSDDTRYRPERSFITTVNLTYVEGIQEHMSIVAGEPMQEGTSGDILEVWMHAQLAEKMGVHVGEEFNVSTTLGQTPIPVRVQGLWQAKDPESPYWFSNPDKTLRESLIVRREDYIARVQPLVPAKTRFVSWHIILDDRKLNPAHAREYASGFERGLAIINKYLPDARLDVSPLDPLKEFVRRQTTLTTLLLGFNIPALGFLLYFLVLTAVIIAHWQRRETAIMVSRGMGVSGVLALTLVEEMLLLVIGYPLGIGFGMLLARAMGHTVSFLSFTGDRPPLPVSLYGLNIPLMLAALGVILIARLWPAARVAKQSVVEQEREYARPIRPPFWHRYYLDLLLVIPTAYAYRQLADKGTLAMLIHDRPEDIYRDPLLVLVPALFVLTAALLTMRIFPILMNLIDWLASRTPWITPHLALRQLGRQSQNYVSPLILVIVSLALGTYTLSLAASLDQWLVDRIYYQVGTDLTFEPYVEGAEDTGDADWIPTPGDFADLPGVAAATRVGDYPTTIDLADGKRVRARFLAIDRLDFPSVAWFRSDFADESLGALMNRLALLPDGILVPQAFLDLHHLQIGDQIRMRVTVEDGLWVDSSFTIAGTYRYFPTAYEDRVTVVGHLDYLISYFSITLPHRIWMRLQEGTTSEQVWAAIPEVGVDAIRRQDAPTTIAKEQAKMERVGVFGTLSIGFLAAAAMAALGLLVYSYASLQARLYRFAVLRAVGLTRRQVVGQIILEYGILTVYGAAAGAMIGAVSSQLFSPFFRITGEKGVPLPPLIPIIAQDRITYLAVAFAGFMVLLELGVLVAALYRRLFDAITMGHHA
ncbi:MAG: ABC transporter permease [Chloroflexi bacterium]|nr:ABC transporter permease [Chloroflexota bacterium]